jgi:hypothetical protein
MNKRATLVTHLLEHVLHRGHTLRIDSFYNSPKQAHCLKSKVTDCGHSLHTNTKCSYIVGEKGGEGGGGSAKGENSFINIKIKRVISGLL